MDKGKYLLSQEEAHATYILRRRRRELKKRLELSEGSENSLHFDHKEETAITLLLNLVRELCREERPKGMKDVATIS